MGQEVFRRRLRGKPWLIQVNQISDEYNPYLLMHSRAWCRSREKNEGTKSERELNLKTCVAGSGQLFEIGMEKSPFFSRFFMCNRSSSRASLRARGFGIVINKKKTKLSAKNLLFCSGLEGQA